MNFGFVLPTYSKQVGEKLAVLRDIENFHVGGVVGAHGIGIEQNLLLASFSFSHADDVLFLIGLATSVDETTIPLEWRMDSPRFSLARRGGSPTRFVPASGPRANGCSCSAP